MNNVLKKGSHCIFHLPSPWWAWVIMIILSWLIYYPAVNNFFLWDDFLWLYRGKTLWAAPGQMFKSEGLYFDPLVYLSFWSDYSLFGTDYRFYHALDITLHALNGILVFYFVRLICGSNLPAILSGIIFVSSFAASDAVFWSSSRVDLIAAFFSLTSIILFLRYLKEGASYLLYIASIVGYILALGAKGTPVVMPALLFFIVFYEGKRRWKDYWKLAPFAAITMMYLGLLWFSSGEVKSPILSRHFPNLHNYALSLTALFVPERLLPKLSPAYAFILILGFIFLLIKLCLKTNNIKRSGYIGLSAMLILLSPLLALGDFKIVSPGADYYYLLASPSHRVYLASIGMSVFMGSAVAWAYEILFNDNKRFVAVTTMAVLIAVFVSVGSYENLQREKKWGDAAETAENIVAGMKIINPTLPEKSIVAVGNFATFPRGFLVPMLKVYYDLREITIFEPLDFFGYLTYPITPSDINRHFNFVAGQKNVYDFTNSVRELLNKRSEYVKAVDPVERKRLFKEIRELALYLNYRVIKLIE